MDWNLQINDRRYSVKARANSSVEKLKAACPQQLQCDLEQHGGVFSRTYRMKYREVRYERVELKYNWQLSSGEEARLIRIVDNGLNAMVETKSGELKKVCWCWPLAANGIREIPSE